MGEESHYWGSLKISLIVACVAEAKLAMHDVSRQFLAVVERYDSSVAPVAAQGLPRIYKVGPKKPGIRL